MRYFHLFVLKIICDSNGQPWYHCRRNHTRILGEPHYFLYYGGNNDTQRKLCNGPGYDAYLKRKKYEDFIIKLTIHGCAGFEKYSPYRGLCNKI